MLDPYGEPLVQRPFFLEASPIYKRGRVHALSRCFAYRIMTLVAHGGGRALSGACTHRWMVVDGGGWWWMMVDVDSVRCGLTDHLAPIGDACTWGDGGRSPGSHTHGLLSVRPAWHSASVMEPAHLVKRDGTRWDEIRDEIRDEMARDGTRWYEMVRDGTRRHEMVRDGTRWHEMARDGTRRWRTGACPPCGIAHQPLAALTKRHADSGAAQHCTPARLWPREPAVSSPMTAFITALTPPGEGTHSSLPRRAHSVPWVISPPQLLPSASCQSAELADVSGRRRSRSLADHTLRSPSTSMAVSKLSVTSAGLLSGTKGGSAAWA